MERKIIVDTGPLVAFLNRDDRFHEWAVEQWAHIRSPMLTCKAVIAESCFLLRHLENGSESVLKLMGRKVLHIGLRLVEEHNHIMKYLRRYAISPCPWRMLVWYEWLNNTQTVECLPWIKIFVFIANTVDRPFQFSCRPSDFVQIVHPIVERQVRKESQENLRQSRRQ